MEEAPLFFEMSQAFGMSMRDPSFSDQIFPSRMVRHACKSRITGGDVGGIGVGAGASVEQQ